VLSETEPLPEAIEPPPQAPAAAEPAPKDAETVDRIALTATIESIPEESPSAVAEVEHAPEAEPVTSGQAQPVAPAAQLPESPPPSAEPAGGKAAASRRPRGRREDRPRVIRNAFGQKPAVTITSEEISIPPFAGADATMGGITTGFDGLAAPPVREMDVFSRSSPASVPGDVFADAPAGDAKTPMDLIRPETEAAAPAGLSSISGASELALGEIGHPPTIADLPRT